jgi:hypothetical protein
MFLWHILLLTKIIYRNLVIIVIPDRFRIIHREYRPFVDYPFQNIFVQLYQLHIDLLDPYSNRFFDMHIIVSTMHKQQNYHDRQDHVIQNSDETNRNK